MHLFNTKYTAELMVFAPSGTTGVAGFFTQANVPVGHYLAVFANCGANTTGTPDWACPDQNGHFNFSQWIQTMRPGLVKPPADGTLSGINQSVPEHP